MTLAMEFSCAGSLGRVALLARSHQQGLLLCSSAATLRLPYIAVKVFILCSATLAALVTFVGDRAAV